MKLITSTAIVLATGILASPAVAQSGASPQQGAAAAAQAQEAPPKVTLSSKAGKQIIDLQTAVKTRDPAQIQAKLVAAQAVAQTKDDKYAIGVLQRQAALDANDNVALAAAVQTLANSGFLDQSKIASLYKDLGVHQFNGKQFPQAVASFQRASSLNPNDPQTQEFLAQGLSASGQNAEAAAAYQRMFQARVAAGQKPSEDLYRHAVAAAYSAKAPNAVELGRQWVAAYPGPDSWHNALAIYRNLGSPDPATALDIMRLARATNSMSGTADYNIYAAETINASNFGEAKAMLDEGLASGKIKATDPVIADIEKALKGKAIPTSSELASREAGAKVPTAFLRVGDAYYGAGNYGKAAAMYRRAAESGADANLANLRLGEALARSGDHAGADAALAKVGGSLAQLAKFWTIYTNGAV